MTPKALRLLQDLRRQLVHPPITPEVIPRPSQPPRNITQEPAPRAVYTAPGTPPTRNREMPEQLVGTVDELGPGSARGTGEWAVLNVNGDRYAVSRRCRHLRADLANGKIDEN